MFSPKMQPRSPSLRSPPVASTPPSSAPARRKHPRTQGPGSPARASRVHFSARGSFADGGMPQETARPAQRGELPGGRRRARKDRTPAMAPGRPRAVASSHSAAGTPLASAELPKGEGPSHCTLRKVAHSSVFGSAGARAGDLAGTHRTRTAARSTPSPPRPSELTAKLVRSGDGTLRELTCRLSAPPSGERACRGSRRARASAWYLPRAPLPRRLPAPAPGRPARRRRLTLPECRRSLRPGHARRRRRSFLGRGNSSRLSSAAGSGPAGPATPPRPGPKSPSPCERQLRAWRREGAQRGLARLRGAGRGL